MVPCQTRNTLRPGTNCRRGCCTSNQERQQGNVSWIHQAKPSRLIPRDVQPTSVDSFDWSSLSVSPKIPKPTATKSFASASAGSLAIRLATLIVMPDPPYRLSGQFKQLTDIGPAPLWLTYWADLINLRGGYCLGHIYCGANRGP